MGPVRLPLDRCSSGLLDVLYFLSSGSGRSWLLGGFCSLIWYDILISSRSSSWCRTINLSTLWAFAADVASLSTAVARLSRSAKRTAVWSWAVARDVAELATSVALGRLSLAVAREVVWSATLVALWLEALAVTTLATTLIATTWSARSTTSWSAVWCWAVTLEWLAEILKR